MFKINKKLTASAELLASKETICGVGVAVPQQDILKKKNPQAEFKFYSFKLFEQEMFEKFPECGQIIFNQRYNVSPLIKYAQHKDIPLHVLSLCLTKTVGDATLWQPMDITTLTDPDSLIDYDPEIVGETLEEQINYIEQEKEAGNRSNTFLDTYKSIVFTQHEELGEREFIRHIEGYISYKWECSYPDQDMLELCENLMQAQKDGIIELSNKFHLSYAAMLGQIGNYARMVKSYMEAPNKNQASKYPALCNALKGVGIVDKPLIQPSDLFNKLIENEKLFKELIHNANGNIAIVGNGPQELGTGNGEHIDAAGLVVRFNNFNTSYPYSHDYGSKTDIWVRMIPHPYVKGEPANVDSLSQVMVTGANRLHRFYSNWEWFHVNINRLPGLCFTPSRPFIELADELGTIPTSGLLLAYMAYLEIGPLKEGTVFGASFAEKGASDSQMYHCSDRTAAFSGRHDMDREKEFFQQIISAKEEVDYYTPLKKWQDDEKNKPTDTLSAPLQATPYSSQPQQYAPYQNWDVKSYTSSFDAIYTTSTGLVDYTIGGKAVQLLENEEQLQEHNALVLGFGLRGSGQKALRLAENGEDIMLCEYGLISGFSIPSKTDFKFSLILDDLGIFFDTCRPSRTEEILTHDQDIASPAIINRSRSFINTIVDNNIVKYNDSACIDLALDHTRQNILLVDQVKGDLSLSLGQCEAYGFEDMLEHALAQPNANIFVKLHPETVQGVKESNFDIEALRANPQVTLIEENCNMMYLLKQIDHLYVMTSGAGLDALMAGKKVTCFGNPFYAGWGLTTDMQLDGIKPRMRSIEEVVAAVFFKQTLWFDPHTKVECSPEHALDALIQWKNGQRNRSAL